MARHRRILLLPGDEKCPKKLCDSSLSPHPVPKLLLPAPPVPSVNKNGHRLTNFFLISAAIFAASILLSLIYYAILRRRRRPVGSATAGAGSEDNDDSVSLDEGQPFHHVWYIRSVGLDESTIASIAVAEYRAGDGLLDGVSDCSVCLCKFCDGEHVRLLPKCGHAFHIPCIDTWLRAHTNCPLCRAHIVEPDGEPAADAGALPITAAGESADLGSGSSDSAEFHQIGNQPLEEVAEDNEEPESMIHVATPVNPSQVCGSLPESSLSQEGKELQPVRRSISLDAPLMNAIIVGLKPDEEDVIDEEAKDPNFDEENPHKIWGKQENLAKGAMDQKGHSDIGRSLSSSGRGFFFSRHGRVARIHSMTT